MLLRNLVHDPDDIARLEVFEQGAAAEERKDRFAVDLPVIFAAEIFFAAVFHHITQIFLAVWDGKKNSRVTACGNQKNSFSLAK